MDLMLTKDDRFGISAVVAILILVAITVILAGVVAIWVFSFMSETNEEQGIYLFNVDLDGSDDAVSISLISGPYLNTSTMDLKIDGIDIDIPIRELRAGEVLTFDIGLDIIPGKTYDIKLIKDNRLVYDGMPVADP